MKKKNPIIALAIDLLLPLLGVVVVVLNAMLITFSLIISLYVYHSTYLAATISWARLVSKTKVEKDRASLWLNRFKDPSTSVSKKKR